MPDDWETIPEADDWETIPYQAPLLKRAGGAFIRGSMRMGGALLDLPRHIVSQVKLIPMSNFANKVLATKDPKKREALLKRMGEIDNFYNKLTGELGKAGEIHKRGQEAILRNHPEWESEPPESFVDLLTSPDKLVVSLAESAPLLLSAGILTAAGAPRVGVMMMYASEGKEAYNRAKAAKQSDDVANDAYFVYGTVAAALESMQLHGIMKIGKGMWNRVLNRTAQKVGRRGAKALTMDVIKVAGQEALEEVAQGEWGDVTAKILYNEPFGPIGAHIDRRAQEAYIGFMMGVLPGGASATTAKVQQKLRANFEAGKAVVPEVTEPTPTEPEAVEAARVDVTGILTETGEVILPEGQEFLTPEQALQIATQAAGYDSFDNVPESSRLSILGSAKNILGAYHGADMTKAEFNAFNRAKQQLKLKLEQQKKQDQPAPVTEPVTPDEAIGKQYGLAPVETNERLGKAELKYREIKNKPVADRTQAEKIQLAFLKRNRKNIEAILDQDTQPMEPKKMTRRQALVLGHKIPDLLGWDEKKRRDFNNRITNNQSMKDMTPAQREQIITALQHEAKGAGKEVEGPESTPVGELAAKLRERKQKPALTRRDRRNMKKLRKALYTMKSGTSFYFLHSSRLKRLCRSLDNYEDNGPFMRYIYQPVKDADTKANVNFTEAMGAAIATMNDLNIDAPAMMVEVKDIGIKDKLSTAERIGVWALAQNNHTMNHLRSEFSEEEIAKIVKSVEATENEMLVAAEVQTYFEQGWPQFEAIAKANGITQMTKAENYITAFVTDKNDLGEANFLEGLMQQFTEGKFVPGQQHTIERQRGAMRNLELNIFVIHARAARAIERFKVMAPVASEVGSVLSKKEFKQALNDVTYGHGARMFDKWLQDAVRGSAAYESSSLSRSLRWLRMAGIHFVLGFKILTAGKQGISFLPAAAVHPGMLPLLLANLERASIGLKYKQMEKNATAKSDLLRTRDWNRDLRQVYNQKAIRKMYKGQKLSPLSMRMATYIDQHTTTIVWTSAYQLARKQMPDASEEQLIRFADGVVEDTQPMGKAVDLPAYFRGNELEKNLTVFQNQVNQNGNIFWYEILGETKARKISLPMAGYRLLMSQVIPAMLLGMVTRGRPPETPGEVAKDLLFYMLCPFVFVGRWAYNVAAGDWGPTRMIVETPFVETGRLVSAVKKAIKDGATDEEIKSIARYSARTVGAWTGGKIPLQAISTAEGAWDLATEQDTDFRRLVWSKYALKKGRKEGELRGKFAR